MNSFQSISSLLLLMTLSSLPCSAEWKRHTIDDTSRGADGVRVADLNGDSLPDLVTGWEEGGKIRVYTNPGAKEVKGKWPVLTVGKVKSPEDAVFVDLDDNGKLDVVSCCEGKTRTVFVHWSTGKEANWKTEAIPVLEGKAPWMYATPMDVDGKHGIDLVIGAKGSGAELGWLESPEDARLLSNWKWHPLVKVGWIMSINSVDMDGDGDLDILYTDRKSATRGVHWLENNPANDQTQTWKQHTIGGTDREVMFLSLGDVNHDRLQDVAVAVKYGPITWFERKDQSGKNWSLHEVAMPATAGSGKGVAIVDVDLDGKNDFVYTCEHSEKKEGVGWLKAPADPTSSDWTPQEISGAMHGIKFDLIQTLDLDQDGDLDIITCEERNNLGVIWYENPTR